MEVNRYKQANNDTIEWAKLVRKRLAGRVMSLSLKDKRAIQKKMWNKAKDEEYKELVPSCGANFRRDYGQIIRINFKFSRHGIFFERGAGRNRRLGTRPKPWLAPILDPAIDQLADMLAKNYADILSGELKILIPGIISKRVQIKEG